LHQRTKFRKDQSNCCGDIAIFVIFFQDVGRRHVGFSSIRYFYRRSPVGDQHVPLCLISSKSVTRLQRYGDFTVIKMAAIQHLGFVKFEFLTVGAVNGATLHQHTKFHKDRSNRCEDIAIFVIFQDGGCHHLGFSKIRNFNDRSAVRVQYGSLYQISSKSVKQLQRYGDLTVFFQNGSRPPSWICWAPIGTTHDDHWMVSIVVQNLVEIDAGVSIT